MIRGTLLHAQRWQLPCVTLGGVHGWLLHVFTVVGEELWLFKGSRAFIEDINAKTGAQAKFVVWPSFPEPFAHQSHPRLRSALQAKHSQERGSAGADPCGKRAGLRTIVRPCSLAESRKPPRTKARQQRAGAGCPPGVSALAPHHRMARSEHLLQPRPPGSAQSRRSSPDARISSQEDMELGAGREGAQREPHLPRLLGQPHRRPARQDCRARCAVGARCALGSRREGPPGPPFPSLARPPPARRRGSRPYACGASSAHLPGAPPWPGSGERPLHGRGGAAVCRICSGTISNHP